MNADKQEIIYAMSDPRNPKLPRYIGRTTTPLWRRLTAHLCWAKTHQATALGKWLNELKSLSLRPNIYALELIVSKDCPKRETYWIQFFRPLGTLTNRSDGDGSLGLKNGPPCALNQSITLPKLKECNKQRSIHIMALETGQTFESVHLATRTLNCNDRSFRRAMRAGKAFDGLHWVIVK